MGHNFNQRERKDRRKPAIDLSTMVYGKVPPQAKDAEKKVLGAIMLERDAFDVANELLKPECFYLESHQLLFQAYQQLQKVGQPIDMVTVMQQLARSGTMERVGGPTYLAEVTKEVTSSVGLETHCLIVIQKYIGRALISMSGTTITDAYDDEKDVFEILSELERRLTEVTMGASQKTFTPIDAAVVESLKRIEVLRQENRDITGIPSGFAPLDHVTYGWQDTDLIILAARPAVGKTAFALNLVTASAESGQPVAFFSMEMSTGQLTNRVLSARSGIWLEKISRGKLEEHEYKHLYGDTAPRVSALPIFFDDTPALTISDLTSRCRKLKRQHGIRLIIVDYLQLMSGESGRSGNREQEISTISRGLKKLAKELCVPIIALSQLSRDVEKRGGTKIPQLSDLRESGAIEQDADMVIFMYRPEYYEQDGLQSEDTGKGETHIRIAKHRNGALETIKLKALLHIQKFVEMDQDGGQPSIFAPSKGFVPVRNFYESNDKDLPF